VPLIGRISGILEIVPTLLRGVEVADVPDGFPKLIDGPGSDASEVCLEL
jgi:hypothetical protein